MKLFKSSVSFLAVLPAAFMLAGCEREARIPMLELLPPEKTGISFSNQLAEDEDLNIITFEYFYNGAGVGIGDINNDGLQDIFFSANMTSNRLYLNRGSFNFEDITEKAGVGSAGKWATGVSMVDINQDGWLDIYVCYAGPYHDEEKRANELFINNGGTFSEQAAAYGLADTGHTVQAAFFDYDKDGYLDVYLLTNMTDETGPNIIRPKRTKGQMVNTDRLYRNNGNGTFTNVSEQAGITIEGYGLGVSIADINGDHWPDIYVSNDYLSNDLLYINNRNGTFTDRAATVFRHTSYSAMGNDVADFNNDGLLDVIALDMLPPDNKRQKQMFGATNYDRYRSEIQSGYSPQFMRNTLQLNRGIGPDSSIIFSEAGQMAGISATDWSWAPLLIDLDNDGWKDLLVTNGYPHDITNRDFASYKANEFIRNGYNRTIMKDLLSALATLDGAFVHNYLFRNNGDLTFSDESYEWGFDASSYSTGAAYGDFDNDGDADIAVNNTNGPAFIYRNNAREVTGNQYLQITFKGPESNLQGLGAKVWIYCGNTVQYFEHSPYRGFQSSVQPGILAGLGKHVLIDSMLVRWPDGSQQLFEDIAASQHLVVDIQGAATKAEANDRAPGKPMFIPGKRASINYFHKETHYADFKVEPLLPHKYSQNGPGIAVGDVNGDGLEDFFIGGAFNQSGEFFIQQNDGSFVGRALTGETKYEEDMGVLLFDANNDGNKDLYTVSGGNEFRDGSLYYQDMLYNNDGGGNFQRNKEALPDMPASGSCVVAADYDGDGDLDLFVGGRLVPQHYPQAGQSFLLRNDGGYFRDVTDEVAPGLRSAGMVTAALWTDTNNDSQVDLVVVGEWMPVTVFENSDGKLVKKANPVPGSSGWWNSITGADFDEDGDTDYVLGNLGLNSRYVASASEPVRIYVADLNDDGRRDPVITHYIDGTNRPAHPRDDLLLQASSLKKKYPDYLSYAEASAEDLLKNAPHPEMLESHTFASALLENKSNGEWQLKPLPLEAQLAPVFGIIAEDFNADGHMDVILTGNSFSTEVFTGRYDASTGLLLLGNGKGDFEPVSLRKSGIVVKEDAKGLALLYSNRQALLLAAQNDNALLVLERTENIHPLITTQDDDFYAMVQHKDGHWTRHEFYYGSSYLSHSSRRLQLHPEMQKLTIYNFEGAARDIYLNDSLFQNAK